MLLGYAGFFFFFFYVFELRVLTFELENSMGLLGHGINSVLENFKKSHDSRQEPMIEIF